MIYKSQNNILIKFHLRSDGELKPLFILPSEPPDGFGSWKD